jgi:ribonuclease HI
LENATLTEAMSLVEAINLIKEHQLDNISAELNASKIVDAMTKWELFEIVYRRRIVNEFNRDVLTV